ncbi:MAG: hypothetical protein ACLQRH_05485 [Acidimicrobiales bacterium]
MSSWSSLLRQAYGLPSAITEESAKAIIVASIREGIPPHHGSGDPPDKATQIFSAVIKAGDSGMLDDLFLSEALAATLRKERGWQEPDLRLEAVSGITYPDQSADSEGLKTGVSESIKGVFGRVQDFLDTHPEWPHQTPVA